MNKYNTMPLEEVVNSAQALSRAVNNSYYDLGEILFFLKETEAYRAVDEGKYAEEKGGWKRFCDEKLDVGYRTAQYWLNIYAYFYGMRVEKDQLDGLGWHKAKELVDLTERQDVLTKAIKFAREHTIDELRGYVKLVKREAPPEAQLYEYETIRFKMPEYKAEQVREAVTLYRELHKDTVNNDADALAEIALEWLQFNTDSNDPEFNLELEQEEQ